MYILTSKQITEVSNVEKEEKEEIRRVDRDSKLVKMHTHGWHASNKELVAFPEEAGRNKMDLPSGKA